MTTPTKTSSTVSQSRSAWLIQQIMVGITRFFSNRWGTLLAWVTSIEMGLLGYYGTFVALRALHAATSIMNPIAWATLVVVFLIEINLLVTMTRRGAKKGNGWFSRYAKQMDQGVHDFSDDTRQDSKRLSSRYYDEVEAEFYFSRGSNAFRREGGAKVAKRLVFLMCDLKLLDNNPAVSKAEACEINDELSGPFGSCVRMLKGDLYFNAACAELEIDQTTDQDDREGDGPCYHLALLNNPKRYIAMQIVDRLYAALKARLAHQDYSMQAFAEVNHLLTWLGQKEDGSAGIDGAYLKAQFWRSVANDLHEASHHEGDPAKRRLYAKRHTYAAYQQRQATMGVIRHYQKDDARYDQNNEGTQDDTQPPPRWWNLYKVRLWAMRIFTVLIITPASAFAGYFLGAHLLKEHILADLFGGMMHSVAGTILQHVFGVLCAFAYFYQMYQTLSTFFLSDASTEWYHSIVDAIRYHWSQTSWFKRVFNLTVLALITLTFLTLSALATICTAGEYVKLAHSDHMIRLFANIAVFNTEAFYGLIYTGKTSAVMNRQYPRMRLMWRQWLRGIDRWRKGERYDALGNPLESAEETPFEAFSGYFTFQHILRLPFLMVAYIADGFNRAVVASFEIILFVGHGILLGLQGVDNPHFSEFLSIVFEAGNEIVQDAALMFAPDERHEHGVFDIICRLLYAVMTFVPAVVSQIAMGFRLKNHNGQLYQLALPFGGRMVCTAYDFRYRWGRYFLSFQRLDFNNKADQDNFLQGNTKTLLLGSWFGQPLSLAFKPTDVGYAWVPGASSKHDTKDVSQDAQKLPINKPSRWRFYWKLCVTLVWMTFVGLTIASIFTPTVHVLPAILLMKIVFPSAKLWVMALASIVWESVGAYVWYGALPSVVMYFYRRGGRSKGAQKVLKDKQTVLGQLKKVLRDKQDKLKEREPGATQHAVLIKQLETCETQSIDGMLQLLNEEVVTDNVNPKNDVVGDADHSKAVPCDVSAEPEDDSPLLDDIVAKLQRKRYQTGYSCRTRTARFFDREVRPLLDAADGVLAENAKDPAQDAQSQNVSHESVV